MNLLIAKEIQEFHVIYTLSGKGRTGEQRFVRIPICATVVAKNGVYLSPIDVPIGEKIQTYGVDILPPTARIKRVCLPIYRRQK